MPETLRTPGLRLMLFVLVWFSAAWFGSWEWNPNNATRMFAAISLVEQGDATIDEFADLTMDKAQFGDHVYLDKAPGMSLMALPAVVIADALTGETARDIPIAKGHPATENFLRLRLRIATATGPALLTAIAALLLFDMGAALGGGVRAGIVAALGYGLGSPVWGWSTTVFGHAAVAALLVIAIWAIWRGTRDDRATPSLAFAALAGVALGWAVVIEYPAALFGGIVGLWALWRLRRFARMAPAVGVGVIAGLVALIPLTAYNMLAFGEPLRVGYSGVVGFEGMKTGLFGLTYPRLEPLIAVTFGTKRGMLWVAPVMVPGLIGLALLARSRAHRDIGVMALVLAATVFLYNASYVYWDGGNSTGPRHAVPALGPIALGLAAVWGAARGPTLRGVLLAVLGMSIAINTAVAAAEIASGGPEAFPLWSDVIAGRFASGQLRSVGNEWLGLSAWNGFTIWLVVATLGLTFLALQAHRLDSTPEVTERM